MRLDQQRVTDILNEVDQELEVATREHESFPTPHHGYAIILEELDEAWEEIKRNDPVRTREEMIQVAAMAIRFLHDIK